jgi:hypothetical protein
MPAETLWQYYKRAGKQFFLYFRKWWGEQIVTALLLSAALYLWQWHSGIVTRSNYLPATKEAFYPYVFILLLFVAIHAIRVPWRLSNEQDRRIDIATGELKAYKDRVLFPEIEVQIRELIAEPQVGRVDCFVHVRIHNVADRIQTTIESAKLTISINGKTYSSSEPLNDLQKYERVVLGEDYDIESGRPETVRLSSSDLIPISANAILTRGVPLNGWLHFRIPGVPRWPEHKEMLGSHTEYDSETGEEYQEDDEEITIKADNIERAELRILDAFGTEYICAKTAGFWNWTNKVVGKTALQAAGSS